MRKSKTLHKPASRITLADLFGDGPMPSPAEIEEAARNEKASAEAKRRMKDKRNGHTAIEPGRLDAIREAAKRTATQPDWTRRWHPTARVFVETQIKCGSCATIWLSPGARTWLIEFTNSRTGDTHTTDPSGPLDRRLPIKKFTHHENCTVCSRCYLGLVQWPPSSVTILKLEHKK